MTHFFTKNKYSSPCALLQQVLNIVLRLYRDMPTLVKTYIANMSAKKIIPLILPILFLFTFTASAQTSATIKGRVIGQNMEELEGVNIINLCNAESATTNNRGFFRINAVKGDSLLFTCKKYSKDQRAVKRLTDNVNVVMITRKTASLPENFTNDEYKTAARADDKLYNILDKGAEREGIWNY
jgi:hypothetical protein